MQDVRVDHGGAHVLVAKELLDGPDIRAAFQKMRGEGVSQGVRRHGLGDADTSGGTFDGTLDDAFVQVMAAPLAGLRVDIMPCGRDDPLPWHERGALGYFSLRASGSSTKPAPSSTSASCWAWKMGVACRETR